MVNQVIDTIITVDGRYELIAYTPDWLPWTHCIRTIINDGKSYERPGLQTCTGWVNFETLEKAQTRFSELSQRDGVKAGAA